MSKFGMKYYTTKFKNERGNMWWVVWEKAPGWKDGVALAEYPSRESVNAYLRALRSFK